MTIPKKRHRVRNLSLREISSVDRPAQVGAVSVLMKRAGEEDVTYETILKSASAVTRGEQPTHSRDDYETALLKRADALAKEQGVTPEQALARNLTTDAEMRDLTNGYEAANAAAYGSSVRKRHGAAA
ncbi:MAG: hypothetical protein PGN12_01910 [Sphingomonas phyllosphaerae]